MLYTIGLPFKTGLVWLKESVFKKYHPLLKTGNAVIIKRLHCCKSESLQ